MRTETIEEFLARGGKITKISAKEREAVVRPLSPTNAGPANLLSLDVADLYYGEARTRKIKKAKTSPEIDFSVLPEALRKKYLKDLLDD